MWILSLQNPCGCRVKYLIKFNFSIKLNKSNFATAEELNSFNLFKQVHEEDVEIKALKFYNSRAGRRDNCPHQRESSYRLAKIEVHLPPPPSSIFVMAPKSVAQAINF